MRHLKKKKFFHGGHAQRQAFLRQFAISFFSHSKIITTATRAKESRPFIERLITIGKIDSLATRRLLIKKLDHRSTAEKLIKVISPKYKDRKGGYTRVVKLNPRQGDGAKQVMLTLV
jgi:large subunit ribosomal protein L17